jgi:hypothetical protein
MFLLIKAFRDLLNNYELECGEQEVVTPEEKKENVAFVDLPRSLCTSSFYLKVVRDFVKTYLIKINNRVKLKMLPISSSPPYHCKPYLIKLPFTSNSFLVCLDFCISSNNFLLLKV